ncbi:uncharacterized protein LOC110093639 isoform X2 [Dendrobium catenatum]|uniref:uncharacterized protein LOC110093639 isoform X2 n=1 Tax=Dendrobium catenatum TaxID=906689 RepID=UPI00109FF75A|nr:uncharacterized protein LOC110093639 isoform X2 [Dendrobium catenatum]
MVGNQMSLAFENRVFNRRAGLGGGRMGCTLVTGFLGSGKTTLLRHLLDNRGDLRLAVLVNEFADSDVDSLLLDSVRLNAAFNLSTVSLTHGCACCKMRGPFRESLQRIVDSKHNFDCLLVETSGLAEPDKFVAELEQVGINLDLTVAVVDAESLEKIIKLDIVKKQLEHVDLVLLNKCDLATLSQVADAEDILERMTGGAKVVRSQFCKVPLDLVIDCSKIDAFNAAKEDCTVPPVLSHEPLSKMAFRGATHGNPSVNISSSIVDSLPLADGDGETSKSPQYGLPQDVSFSSVTFESEAPLSLSLFQSKVLTSVSNTIGLLRGKGILCFLEDRKSRFVFQWSGLKKVEAISARPWDGAPKSCLVFIGHDKSALDDLIAKILQIAGTIPKLSTNNHISQEYARSFSMKVAADGRFKDPSLQKEPLVIFGLKGSPLRGIKEAHLSGALMRVVNGKGNIFLTATVSGEGMSRRGANVYCRRGASEEMLFYEST